MVRRRDRDVHDQQPVGAENLPCLGRCLRRPACRQRSVGEFSSKCEQPGSVRAENTRVRRAGRTPQIVTRSFRRRAEIPPAGGRLLRSSDTESKDEAAGAGFSQLRRCCVRGLGRASPDIRDAGADDRAVCGRQPQRRSHQGIGADKLVRPQRAPANGSKRRMPGLHPRSRAGGLPPTLMRLPDIPDTAPRRIGHVK